VGVDLVEDSRLRPVVHSRRRRWWWHGCGPTTKFVRWNPQKQETDNKCAARVCYNHGSPPTPKTNQFEVFWVNSQHFVDQFVAAMRKV
jgi:hypothetical protein